MKSGEVKCWLKQCITLMLIFLLVFPGEVWAKRKKPGAGVVVTKKDGEVVAGELLNVKDHSLVLWESESRADVSIEIDEIRKIRIIKKSKFWKGFGIGFSIGGTLGIIDYIKATKEDDGDDPVIDLGALGLFFLLAYVVIYGTPLGLIGGGIGLISGKDKHIVLEGKTQEQQRSILKKLREMARFK